VNVSRCGSRSAATAGSCVFGVDDHEPGGR